MKRKVLKMRRIKKTFVYSQVEIIDKLTHQVLVAEKREGKQDETTVAIDYIKNNGYNPNLGITITELSETYVMSSEDFMKHGEKIEEEITEKEGN